VGSPGGNLTTDQIRNMDSAGLEAPNPLLDPANYIGGLGTGAIKWANRPYWRYIGSNSNPTSGWMTRGWGWKPPYGTNFSEAKNALQMPFEPTEVTRIDVPWYQPVRGPRPANLHPEWGGGGGSEYFRGWRWPE